MNQEAKASSPPTPLLPRRRGQPTLRLSTDGDAVVNHISARSVGFSLSPSEGERVGVRGPLFAHGSCSFFLVVFLMPFY